MRREVACGAGLEAAGEPLSEIRKHVRRVAQRLTVLMLLVVCPLLAPKAADLRTQPAYALPFRRVLDSPIGEQPARRTKHACIGPPSPAGRPVTPICRRRSTVELSGHAN